MDTDQGTVVLRRFQDRLHGATILTLHCESARPAARFGADVLDHLSSEHLLGHVLWSTSCTPGDVLAAGLHRLRDNGLFLVRLRLSGIAGDPARLRDLVAAVQMLRRLGILISYDVDLFGGSPRFAAVRDNVAMLRAIVADGTTPAVFQIGAPEGTCSPWLDLYRSRLGSAVEPWLGAQGLSAQLAEAWAEHVVTERLQLGVTGGAAHRIALQRLTLRSNTDLLNLVADSAREFETSGDTTLLDAQLIASRTELLVATMVALRKKVLAASAPVLLAGGS